MSELKLEIQIEPHKKNFEKKKMSLVPQTQPRVEEDATTTEMETRSGNSEIHKIQEPVREEIRRKKHYPETAKFRSQSNAAFCAAEQV